LGQKQRKIEGTVIIDIKYKTDDLPDPMNASL
jgi:hypothetical protein